MTDIAKTLIIVYSQYAEYCYDTVSGWYYLQSRYYDPVVCRFINSDTVASTGHGVVGCNMFAYCFNNPTNYYDDGGFFPVAIPFIAWGKVLFDAAATVLSVVVAWEIGLGFGETIIETLGNDNNIKPVPSTGVQEIDVCATSDGVLTAGKRNNLPSKGKITVDWPHIMSGHSSGGNRGGPNKDRFPGWMSTPLIQKAVMEAYKNAEKIGPVQHSWSQGVETVKQLFQGKWNGMNIQFWFDYTRNRIDSAWPKW